MKLRSFLGARWQTAAVDETLRLIEIDEGNLPRLLAAAVAGSSPEEVMPPVGGPPGWTPENREAFRAFHRERFAGLAGPLRSAMYAIVAGGETIGMIRLTLKDDAGTAETGLWLARTVRGRGYGAAALRALLAEAAGAGARRVVAETTAANAPALGVLRRCGATTERDGDAVRAEIALCDSRAAR